MEKSLFLAELCIVFGFLDTVRGFPIDFPSLGAEEPSPLWLTNYSLTAVGFIITVVGVIFGCVCCRNGKGFKEFSNSSASLAAPRPEGFVNPTSNSELTIFPPAGANSNQICRFEPLPDIKPQAPNLRPAAFSYSEREISSQDWFSEPYNCFPRNQLKYVQEYGRGWFGRVVEGEAQSITSKEKLTKVMVKILHEDATPTDQMYFLHEVKFYRDLNHPNILRLLGRCLETEPFLIILEHYPNGDLKSFLSQNLASARALVEQGVTLQMCSNITNGLQFMHENKFIHTDLAARNCLVGPDLTVKIGDYGNSIEIFKSDYYCAGSVALPVRWCAPETLKCTDVTIETREVTPPANIWSLAVVFWEICEFCKLPYAELNDDQVIVRVLGEKNYFLEKPNMFCLHKDELYHLMKLCWNSPLQRPTASQISVILDNLIASDKATRKDVQSDLKLVSQDFEQRWKNFKPNYIPKKDNAVEVDHSANCSIISSKLKNAKVVDSSLVDSPLGIFMSNVGTGQESPRVCLKSDKEKPSKGKEGLLTEQKITDEKQTTETGTGDNVIRNLKEKVDFEISKDSKQPDVSVLSQKFKGDVADVDSWLKGVEINNEEDESFVRKISEAIRDLDATLAMEKTSSSEETSGKSSHQNSPGKDLKQGSETTVDFKLGSDTSSFMNFTQKSFELTSLQNTEQPQSLDFTDPFLMSKKNELDESYGPSSLILPLIENSKSNFNIKNDVFDESLKENDSLVWNQSRNSSDTDDEIWRKRIERGEISEKVKEKSKSIANLMILTHIDPSDDSDIDIDKPFDKGLGRNAFLRSGSFAKSSLSSNNFGSENDITYAVLEDDFKESLKKLSNDHKEHGHFDSLGMILPVSARRENVWENFFKASDTGVESSRDYKVDTTTADVNKTKDKSEKEGESNVSPVEIDKNFNPETSDNFLGNVASEKLNDNNLLQNINESISPTEDSVKTCSDLEGDNILIEKNLNCDSITCNTDSGNSSEEYSSQLKEVSIDNSDTLNINKIKESPSLDDIDSDCINVVSDTKKEIEITESRSSIGEDSPLNKVRDNEAVVQNIGSENTLVVSSLKETHSVPVSCLKDDSENVKENINVIESPISKSQSDLTVIPKITMTEAEENNTAEVEEVFEPFIPKSKPFRFVLKDKDLVPQITITEEPEEELMNEEEETFEFFNPTEKRFKFFFKENDEINVEENSIKPDDKKPDIEKAGDLSQKPSDSLLDSSYFSNDVGNKVEPIDSSNVIIGACEDFTLDYFKGLKTTSEDINVENVIVNDKEENLQKIIEDLRNKEANLDVWDKHLEKAFTQLNDSDFNDISFKSFGETDVQPAEIQEQNKNEEPENRVECSIKTIADFIESEKIHTEKMEEPIHINPLTNLTGIGSEEEFDNFKLRTPDDERSSDSGFRDKGSLSESVEDACEGKYNLEDIEAELEEAYVKGAFGNCEVEKEKDSNKDSSKNCINFEYEESKFYEDASRNEEDFSDIDGEIEFWQSKDTTDYYPQISEFNPICSQGWYLHPPDESMLSFDRNVDEDLVNALRNELRESLPVQARSFEKCNDDFYESEIDDTRKELNIHYIADYGQPLSPIVEEQDEALSETSKKNIKNSMFDGSDSNKVRRNIVNLMESVKSIDTNTFKEYLDYMIENEGKDLFETEEVEERIVEGKEEDVNSPLLILKKDDSKNSETKNFVEDIKNALGIDSISRSESLASDVDQSSHVVLVEDLDSGSTSKVEEVKAEDDILVVNIDTNEVTLLESPKPKSFMAFVDTPQRKDDFLEVITDNSENEGLIFTPEMLSPDRERSLSEISRSSNGTRTGDALSDITLSSPDLVPDCFSTSVHEIIQNNEASEIIKELEDSGIINEADASLPNSAETNTDSPPNISKSSIVQNELFLTADKINASDTSSLQKNLENESEDLSEASKKMSTLDYKPETDELYEMSTSFMGDDDEDDDGEDDEDDESYTGLCESKQKQPNAKTIDQKLNKEVAAEGNYTPDWESESSGGEEEISSSSGEFIWKDGEKESKVKVVQASDCDIENTQEKSQSDQSSEDVVTTSIKENSKEEKNEEAEEDDDDNDNESSTGSSASITDFVPSAWNSQATPSRPALRSPDKKVDQQQKKSVWFKKQKYHCVYEYPREPSDSEDADISPYNPFSFEKNTSETPNKHFTFGVNTVELPNKHFPYGISNVINYSSYTDWDVLEEDGDLSLTDTDSDNGLGKSELGATKESDFNFYNLSPFDYDFNSAGMSNDESEFFVSSSSRPFQGGPSSQSFPGNKQSTLFSYSNDPKDANITGNGDLTDFITPDSGLEDSANVTPLDKKVNLNHQNILLHVDNSSTDSKPGILNILDNLKFNFTPEIVESNIKKIDLETFGENANTNGNGVFAPSSNNASNILSPSGLGQLRHARNKLKLDLPHNHNAELGAVVNKKNQQNSLKL